MVLKKTTEYAIRILSFMSMSKEELISAKSIYETLKIPKKYLSRLLTNLSKNGFIKSIQGRNGGYSFVKGTHQIFISDIIEAVEGGDPFNSCILGFEECMFEKPCAMHNIWAETKENISKALRTTTLADFAGQKIVSI